LRDYIKALLNLNSNEDSQRNLTSGSFLGKNNGPDGPEILKTDHSNVLQQSQFSMPSELLKIG